MTKSVFTVLLNFSITLTLFSSICTNAAEKNIRKTPLSTPYCSNMILIDKAERIEESVIIDKADYIVVSKSRRALYLLSKGRVLNQFKVAFGSGLNAGAKEKEGDGRTPEGMYFIESKNPGSSYHLALKISYPNSSDIEFANKMHVRPGSNIMIHGFPGSFVDNLIPDNVKSIHPNSDWTQGCIAVTDREIEEIFSLISNRTPVEICPLEK
ncbi:MAG: L,D-transpeptidase family protein [Pseudobdellovibrio sp.]